MRDGCRDGSASEVARGVHAEVFAAGAVRFGAARRDTDESGVLAGARRDEDVIVGGTPVQRLSR